MCVVEDICLHTLILNNILQKIYLYNTYIVKIMGTRKQNRKSNRNKKQKGGCGCDGGFKLPTMNGGDSFATPSFNANTLNPQYYNSFNGTTGTGGDILTVSNQIGTRYEPTNHTTPMLMGGRRKKGGKKIEGGRRKKSCKNPKRGKRNSGNKSGKMRGGNLSVSGFFTNLSGQSSNPYTTTYQPISEFKTNLARPPLA
jgi:hypothetical protein